MSLRFPGGSRGSSPRATERIGRTAPGAAPVPHRRRRQRRGPRAGRHRGGRGGGPGHPGQRGHRVRLHQQRRLLHGEHRGRADVHDQPVGRRHGLAQLQRHRAAGSELVLAGGVGPGRRGHGHRGAERELHRDHRVGDRLVRQRHTDPLPGRGERPEQHLHGRLRQLGRGGRTALDQPAERQRDQHGVHAGRDQRRHRDRVHRHLLAGRADPVQVLLEPAGDEPDRARHHRQRHRRVHGLRQPGEQRGRAVLPGHRAAGHHRQPAVQLPVVGAQPDRSAAAQRAVRAVRADGRRYHRAGRAGHDVPGQPRADRAGPGGQPRLGGRRRVRRDGRRRRSPWAGPARPRSTGRRRRPMATSPAR